MRYDFDFPCSHPLKAICDQAEKLSHEEDYDAAISLYWDIIDRLRVNADDPKLLLDCLWRLVVVYRFARQFEKSMVTVQEAFTLCDEVSSPANNEARKNFDQQRIKLLFQKVLLHEIAEDIPQQIETLNRMIYGFDGCTDEEVLDEVVWAIEKRISVLDEQREHEAARAFEQEIINRNFEDERLVIRRAVCKIAYKHARGFHFLATRKYEEEIAACRRVVELFADASDKEILARVAEAYSQLSDTYIELKWYDESLRAREGAIALLKTSSGKDDFELLHLLGDEMQSKTNLLAFLKRHGEAIQCCNQTIEYFAAFENEPGVLMYAIRAALDKAQVFGARDGSVAGVDSISDAIQRFEWVTVNECPERASEEDQDRTTARERKEAYERLVLTIMHLYLFREHLLYELDEHADRIENCDAFLDRMKASKDMTFVCFSAEMLLHKAEANWRLRNIEHACLAYNEVIDRYSKDERCADVHHCGSGCDCGMIGNAQNLELGRMVGAALANKGFVFGATINPAIDDEPESREVEDACYLEALERFYSEEDPLTWEMGFGCHHNFVDAKFLFGSVRMFPVLYPEAGGAKVRMGNSFEDFGKVVERYSDLKTHSPDALRILLNDYRFSAYQKNTLEGQIEVWDAGIEAFLNFNKTGTCADESVAKLFFAKQTALVEAGKKDLAAQCLEQCEEIFKDLQDPATIKVLETMSCQRG